jgi:polysaccharide export outer membrane protein
MNKIFKSVLVLVIAAAASACTTTKDLLYFQDINERQLKAIANEYEAVIKTDDRLSIIVSGADKTVTAPYNLTLSELGTASGSIANPEQSTLSYLVDSEGNIEFPILGRIHVEGLTRNQLVKLLTDEIGKDVKDPIVYVSFRNYKITVLGEVRNPGTYTMDSEKINVLQALGKAGDLLLTANRDGILLLREENGVQQHYTIDLRSSDILESPYFYLQQNDVLFVPASATRAMVSNGSLTIWGSFLSSVSTAVSVITLIVALSK